MAIMTSGYISVLPPEQEHSTETVPWAVRGFGTICRFYLLNRTMRATYTVFEDRESFDLWFRCVDSFWDVHNIFEDADRYSLFLTNADSQISLALDQVMWNKPDLSFSEQVSYLHRKISLKSKLTALSTIHKRLSYYEFKEGWAAGKKSDYG